jgi:hypothetical protein
MAQDPFRDLLCDQKSAAKPVDLCRESHPWSDLEKGTQISEAGSG